MSRSPILPAVASPAWLAPRVRKDGRRRVPGPAVCALGYAGAVTFYLPLLTLLLPLRVEAIAPASRFGVLTTASIAGAAIAAGTNILFGLLSDRSVARGGSRRGWIAAGLAATLASYLVIARADTASGLVAAVMLFQTAMNLLLAPLLALISEEVPDRCKGYLGGLLAGAHPAAALFCALLVAVGPTGFGARLAFVGTTAGACLLPLLLSAPGSREPSAGTPSPMRRDLAIAWGARLAFQIAGSVLFAYLLYVMEAFADGVDPSAVPGRIASLMAAANLLPLPMALALGRFSDRLKRRKPFIAAAGGLAALGLVRMATAHGWNEAAIGYGIYAIGNGAFLALQIGFVMELLPDPHHRGRDLGFINLANTLPVLIGPALTWWLAAPGSPALLLLALAGLSLAGGLAMLAVRSRR